MRVSPDDRMPKSGPAAPTPSRQSRPDTQSPYVPHEAFFEPRMVGVSVSRLYRDSPKAHQESIKADRRPTTDHEWSVRFLGVIDRVFGNLDHHVLVRQNRLAREP